MKKLRLLLAFMIIFFLPGFPTYPETNDPAAKLLVLDVNFYRSLSLLQPIARDDFLQTNINRVVQTRGIIKAVGQSTRYRKRFRITLLDADAAQYRMNIYYYIFFDDESSANMLNNDELFEFSGQLMSCTPLSSRRDGYIFDIMLEKGAVIVK